MACLRIAATYRVFNQTWDEPAHIAAGLEWLERGEYTFEPLHPPLSRIVFALGPFLAGARLTPGEPNPWVQAAHILGAGADYRRMLALARAGNLAFFLIAGVAVFLLTRRAVGAWPAVVAILLFTTLAPVLAHAGFATTDLALVAGTAVTLVAFISWLDQPDLRRGVLLGAIVGGTLLTKFSAILFVPAVLAVTAVCARLWGVYEPVAARAGKPLYRLLRPVWLTALVVIWAGYRFSVGPIIPTTGRPHCESSTPCNVDSLPAPVAALITAPVYPTPELIRGLVAYGREGRAGRKAYLFGQHNWNGWWYFFPVAVAIKTPIPFLILSLLGIGVVIAARPRAQVWLALACGASAGGVLAVLMLSRVNIGLRHALVIYPLLSLVAAYGAARLWNSRRAIGPLLVAVLIAWQVWSSIRTAPDFIAYFNELAPGPPEQYLIDSDLDWGQDLGRLADTMRSRNIRGIALAYNGSADPKAVGIERYRWLRPFIRDTGWIAISVFTLEIGEWNSPTWDDYAWLRPLKPVTRAGRSILLYRVEADTTRSTGN